MVLSTVFEGNDISLIFIDQLNGLLIVYRDLFAKRSLILQQSIGSQEILFSSVKLSSSNPAFELPPNSLMCLSILDDTILFKRWPVTPSMLRFNKEMMPLEEDK